MYKLHKDNFGGVSVVVRDDGDGKVTCIPFDPANTDYQAYLKWLEEGNTPMSADADGEPADE